MRVKHRTIHEFLHASIKCCTPKEFDHVISALPFSELPGEIKGFFLGEKSVGEVGRSGQVVIRRKDRKIRKRISFVEKFSLCSPFDFPDAMTERCKWRNSGCFPLCQTDSQKSLGIPKEIQLNMNSSKILGSLKIDWKGKKGYGTQPDSWSTPRWHPRLVGNCLVCIYQFFNFKF